MRSIIRLRSGNVCCVRIERDGPGGFAAYCKYGREPSDEDSQTVDRIIQEQLLKLFPARLSNPVDEYHNELLRWAHSFRN